jgi:hypothetical protein
LSFESTSPAISGRLCVCFSFCAFDIDVLQNSVAAFLDFCPPNSETLLLGL